MKQNSHEDAYALLRQSGHRATEGRARILEVLVKEQRPMTVLEIIKKLGHAGLNEATLYRALEALASSLVIRRVDLQKGNARHYEFVLKHHHHVVCLKCGVIEPFSNELCGRIAERAIKKSKLFKKASDHSLEVFGVCVRCLNKNHV